MAGQTSDHARASGKIISGPDNTQDVIHSQGDSTQPDITSYEFAMRRLGHVLDEARKIREEPETKEEKATSEPETGEGKEAGEPHETKKPSRFARVWNGTVSRAATKLKLKSLKAMVPPSRQQLVEQLLVEMEAIRVMMIKIELVEDYTADAPTAGPTNAKLKTLCFQHCKSCHPAPAGSSKKH